MTAALPPPSEACRAALAQLEADPLDLPQATWDHLQHCPACAEAQVAWLAQEDADPALTPAGYFERLPSRVLAKLPARPCRTGGHPLWWAAAGMLLATVTGGFFLGRHGQAPARVEATLAAPPQDSGYEVLPDTPFLDGEEGLDPLVPGPRDRAPGGEASPANREPQPAIASQP